MGLIDDANPKVDTLQHFHLLDHNLIGGDECVEFGNPLFCIRLFVEELVFLDNLAAVGATMVHDCVDVGPILEFTFPVAES